MQTLRVHLKVYRIACHIHTDCLVGSRSIVGVKLKTAMVFCAAGALVKPTSSCSSKLIQFACQSVHKPGDRQELNMQQGFRRGFP